MPDVFYRGLKLRETTPPVFEDEKLWEWWVGFINQQSGVKLGDKSNTPAQDRRRYLCWAKERDKRRAEFMQAYSLSETAAKSATLRHLTSGQATSRYSSNILDRDILGVGPGFFFDHVSMFWHKDLKRYVITVQPYSLTLEKLTQAETDICEPHGLDLWLSYERAWWYPGAAPLIAVAKAEVIAALFGSQSARIATQPGHLPTAAAGAEAIV